MAKAKWGWGWGASPGLCPGYLGQAGSRGLFLSKATACFSYKMAEGCVGHFVAPLEDKGRGSQRVGPADAWQGGERTTYQNKVLPWAEAQDGLVRENGSSHPFPELSSHPSFKLALGFQ